MVLVRALIGVRSSSSKSNAIFFIFNRHYSLLTTSEESSIRLVKQKIITKLKTGCSNIKDPGARNFDAKLVEELFSALGSSVGFDNWRHESRCSDQATVKIIEALQDGDRENATSLLYNHNLCAEDFVNILRYCAISPDPLFALQTWNAMEAKDIIPGTLSYDLIVRTLCKGGYVEEAFNFLKCAGEGYSFCTDLAVYNNFLFTSVQKGYWSYVNQCLDLMNQRMVGMNESTYAQLLKVAVGQKNLSAINQIWEDYIKHYSVTVVSLKKFVAAFSRLGDINSANQKLQQMIELAIYQANKVKNVLYDWVPNSKLDIPIPMANSLLVGTHNAAGKSEDASLKEKSYTLSAGTNFSLLIGNSYNESFPVGKLAIYQEKLVGKLLKKAFRDVINTCSVSESFGLAERLMIQMHDLGLQPTNQIYHAYAKVLIQENRVAEVLGLLQMMQKINVKPLDSTLLAISMACSDSLAIAITKELQNQISDSTTLRHYNHFLKACDRLNLPDRAIQVYRKMKKHNIRPNVRTYALLFSLFGNVNFPYEAGNILSQGDCWKRVHAIEVDMTRNSVQHNHRTIMHLLKALVAEGMMTEFMQYLRVAEAIFPLIEDEKEAIMVYNAVMHSLVKADRFSESQSLTIEIFKNMRASGFQPDSATYCIMIDCCSTIKCYLSAFAVASMMIRSGYGLDSVTYCALMKAVLRCGNLEEALKILDEMVRDQVQANIVAYNSILRTACNMRRLDVIEIIVEQMHRSNVKPDSSTCSIVFSAYVSEKYYNTAVEALQVLMLRMIGLGDNLSLESFMSYAGECVLEEGSGVEMQILRHFESSENEIAVALLTLRWCAMLGFPLCLSSSNDTFWARKTSVGYDCMQ